MSSSISISLNDGELRSIKDSLSPKVYKRILTQSANEAARFGATQISREIRKELNLKASYLRPWKSVKTAKPKQSPIFYARAQSNESNPTAIVSVSQRFIPLIRFDPKPAKRGISVKVRHEKGRQILPGTFIVKGGKQVRERQRLEGPAQRVKAGRKFVFRSPRVKRYPMDLRMGPTVYGVLTKKPGFLNAIYATIRAKFVERLNSKVGFVLSGGSLAKRAYETEVGVSAD